jgi:hypothetical protein
VARVKSFAQATELIRIWTGIALSSRQVGRIAEAIGAELVELRDQEVDDFTHHRRQPEGIDPQHELAAVFVDGGRVQIGDDPRDQSTGFWREDKIARLQTMSSTTFAIDPCPEPPSTFLNAQKVAEQVPNATPPRREKPGETSASATTSMPSTPTYEWVPKPLVRTCVGTMESIEEFRWMVQAEAKRRHFFTAQKRAFVADGIEYNWRLQADHFPDFVPILDFLHVSSYVHQAAQALGDSALGATWVRAIWQGRVAEVVSELLRQLGYHDSHEQEAEGHALRAAWDAVRYLSRHAEKMEYPRYRREGLPCTSSLIESQVKEFNARLKGSEKFWNRANAEAMLQLVCWTLREDGPTLTDYFASRRGNPFRQRRETKTLAL